jgi:hypothetical protein
VAGGREELDQAGEVEPDGLPMRHAEALELRHLVVLRPLGATPDGDAPVHGKVHLDPLRLG